MSKRKNSGPDLLPTTAPREPRRPWRGSTPSPLFFWAIPAPTREPLPAWHLMHLAAELPGAVTREQRAEEGRTAVGHLGCAHCHASAFPGITAAPPGPALTDVGSRVNRAWLLDWLQDPARARP